MLLEEKSIFFYTWNARTNNFKVEKKTEKGINTYFLYKEENIFPIHKIL